MAEGVIGTRGTLEMVLSEGWVQVRVCVDDARLPSALCGQVLRSFRGVTPNTWRPLRVGEDDLIL